MVIPVVYPQSPEQPEEPPALEVDAAIDFLLAERTLSSDADLSFSSWERSSQNSPSRCVPHSPAKPVCSPPVDKLPMPPRDGPCKQWSKSQAAAPFLPMTITAPDDPLEHPLQELESPTSDDMRPYIRTMCLQQQQLERRFEAWMFQLKDYMQHRLAFDVAEKIGNTVARPSFARARSLDCSAQEKRSRSIAKVDRRSSPHSMQKTEKVGIAKDSVRSSGFDRASGTALKPIAPFAGGPAYDQGQSLLHESAPVQSLACATVLGKDTVVMPENEPINHEGFTNGDDKQSPVAKRITTAARRRHESCALVDNELQVLAKELNHVTAPAVKREKMRITKAARASAMKHARSDKSSITMGSRQACLNRAVSHPAFDAVVAVLIIANSVLIGVMTEMSYNEQEEEVWLIVVGHSCNFCFLLELLLRALSAGKNYFHNDDRYWNMFDSLLVAFSILDLVMTAVDREEASDPLGSGQARTGMKTIKMFRIVRIFRVFRFFRELSLLAIMIADSLKSLIWAMLMLTIIIYVFAIVFSTAAADHLRQSPFTSEDDPVRKQFGSLPKTIYFLVLSMMNGISWGEVCNTLMDVDIISTVFFFFYVAFTILAVLNIITGVFVDNAVETAKTQRDFLVQREIEIREKYVQDLRDLFHAMDEDGSGTVTWQEMDDHFSDSRMRGYFNTLGLQVDDLKRLFSLIDDDGSGEVEVDEFLDGCLRLKGEARSIDVHTVLHECKKLGHRFEEVYGPRELHSPVIAKHRSDDSVFSQNHQGDGRSSAASQVEERNTQRYHSSGVISAVSGISFNLTDSQLRKTP